MMLIRCVLSVVLFALTVPAWAGEPVFRVGHPDLAEGCAAPEAVADPHWQRYLSLLSERLAQAVEGCGITAQDAPDRLRSGTVDFALARVSLNQEVRAALRPLLRIRRAGQLPRSEVVVLTTDPDAEHVIPPLMAALSFEEMMALTSVAEKHALDDPKTAEMARAASGAYAQNWPPGAALVDPVEALSLLKRGDAAGLVYMTQGRYLETCTRLPDLCDGLILQWRGFAPLAEAYAVADTMAHEILYRLIGIHVALHVDDLPMLRRIGGGDAEEFEPTEPTAFRFENRLQ